MKKLLTATATAFAAALLAANLASHAVAAENAGADGRGNEQNEISQAESLFLGYLDECREELKAKDVVEIDVRGKSSVCDYMVIASGTSTRHVKSVADEVVRFAKRLDVMPLGVEGEREAEWVLVDLGDVVVHVMLPRVREFYALERLWTVGDQPPEFEQ